MESLKIENLHISVGGTEIIKGLNYASVMDVFEMDRSAERLEGFVKER